MNEEIARLTEHQHNQLRKVREKIEQELKSRLQEQDMGHSETIR